MKPTFFTSGHEFRTWLDKYHSTSSELPLGFYKTAADRKGITYKQALDEALCYGWIDGVRKNLDRKATGASSISSVRPN
jgi:uncharacterized protein YdeI (YjbR/CyaY-like superfamily)